MPLTPDQIIGNTQVISGKLFTVARLQTTIFTPGLQFSGARVLQYLLNVEGEPTYRVIFSAELPADFPAEVPRVVLQSEDGGRRIQASPGRLDLLVSSQDTDKPFDPVPSLGWAVALFDAYAQHMPARVGRLACVITRTAIVEDAATSLARHICKETFTSDSGALRRSDDFEIRSRKMYWLKSDLMVNSWMRCYAGPSLGAIGGPPSDHRTIVVDQDINTLVEDADKAEYSHSAISEFFHMMPEQFDRIMGLYFGE
jgi:hypothetical protein